MKKTNRKHLSFITAIILIILTMFSSVSAFASAPEKEEVKYKGAGKVEVEFYGDVSWKGKPKITVTDASGKAYKTSVISYDDDDVKFKIKNYKKGKKYTFKIKNVRKEGTKEYGTVKGKVTIPKDSNKSVTRDKARTIALNHAEKKYKINKSKIYDYDIEKDTYRGKAVWEIDFDTYKKGVEYSYDYKIEISTGKILYFEQEIDD